MKKRLLLLSPVTGYRIDAYGRASQALGVEMVLGANAKLPVTPHAGPHLALNFGDLDAAVTTVVDAARQQAFDGVLGTDETTALLAARVAERLGLRHCSVEAALCASDKTRMRRALHDAGVSSPRHLVLRAAEDARGLTRVSYPCVVKPAMLSGSQGVIRADDPSQLAAAVTRIRALLDGHPSAARQASGFTSIIVEDFVPGSEVAVEGLMDAGRLEVLACFDKPDPLDGPYFEETIYVTPSRHPRQQQQALARVVEQAAAALSLRDGPIHAELRMGSGGAVVIEVAARSIGGLCSRVFEASATNLEALLVAQAVGLPRPAMARCEAAAGVMMIPIGSGGVMREVRGLAQARSLPCIREVVIQAKVGRALRPLPEGSGYLGFIFASGPTPQRVEAALRQAHAALEIDLRPLLN